MNKALEGLIARIGGPESYSDKATRELFGDTAKILRCDSIRACLESLSGGKAARAVVPVRNAIIGDIIMEGKTVKKMADELGLLRVMEHRQMVFLVLASYGRLEDIRIVYSIQPALDQCKKFFDRHKKISMAATIGGKNIKDTSTAAGHVKNSRVRYTAAICDADAAKIHRVPVVLSPVADKEENFTTFYVYEKRGSGESPGSVAQG